MQTTLEEFLVEVAKHAIRGEFYDVQDKYHMDWKSILNFILDKREELQDKKIM